MNTARSAARHHRCDTHGDQDAALLELLTGPSLSPAKAANALFTRRDAHLDPLLIAAVAASGPHVTRNHYQHDFFPGVMLPQAEGSWDWTKFTGEDSASLKQQTPKRLTYVSRQAPRRLRLQGSFSEHTKENGNPREIDPPALDNPHTPKKRRSSLVNTINVPADTDANQHRSQSIPEAIHSHLKPRTVAPLEVKCMARTRIPTPHGPAFLHLYHNNRDNKEHLAIVVDSAQFTESNALSAPPIRSRSLDAVWSEDETEMDRITRGAYVGRLSSTSQHPSAPASPSHSSNDSIPSPLIRIHSECFTGETIGSLRCDCGEQLDEAIRLISQPITLLPSSASASPFTIPGRGAVIYLRQEGRGIGLLSKIRAYNLQDLGHDTVTANLMLGHQADERGYEIAVAILRDLGLGSESKSDQGAEGVRVLTNNPDKIQALEKEGLRVVERVPMIPRSWQGRSAHLVSTTPPSYIPEKDGVDEKVTGSIYPDKSVYGEDLDRYLRTKVLKMGHMLPLWLEDPETI